MKIFNRKHNHNWIATTPFIIKKNGKEFVRVCCYCKKCGEMCHKHLPSDKEVEK